MCRGCECTPRCRECECTPRLLHAADVLWACLVVGPLTIIYWGGTWKLMDDYVFQTQSKSSAFISLGVGAGGGFVAYMMLPLIDEWMEVRCHWTHILLSRVIIYLQNGSTLNYWRGIWMLMDVYAGSSLPAAVIAAACSLFLLLILRASSNAISSPFTVTVDTRSSVYKTAPLLRVNPNHVMFYTVDSALSHFVVVPLVVQLWRGLWYILDECVLPGNLFLSYIVCLGAGYAAAALLFLLQHPVRWLAVKLHRTHWFLELTLEDVFKLLTVCASLLLWRGGWGLMKDYVLQTTVIAWSAHAAGTAMLFLLQLASTVGTATITRDCELGQGTGILYKIQYFTHFHEEYTAYSRRRMLRGPSPVERQGLVASTDISSDDEFYQINA